MLGSVGTGIQCWVAPSNHYQNLDFPLPSHTWTAGLILFLLLTCRNDMTWEMYKRLKCLSPWGIRANTPCGHTHKCSGHLLLPSGHHPLLASDQLSNFETVLLSVLVLAERSSGMLSWRCVKVKHNGTCWDIIIPAKLLSHVFVNPLRADLMFSMEIPFMAAHHSSQKEEQMWPSCFSGQNSKFFHSLLDTPYLGKSGFWGFYENEYISPSGILEV